MAFDVETFRAAHRPWLFQVGRHAFEARHVSAPQVFRYQDMIHEAGSDRRKLDRALRWLLRHAFPWRFSYLLRGDPVEILLLLEPAARHAALADFFASLHGGPQTIPTPSQSRTKNGTSGTRSLTPTLTPRA